MAQNDTASEAHTRVQRILALRNVGGPRYSAEDALFDIEQVYVKTFGPLPAIKEVSK